MGPKLVRPPPRQSSPTPLMGMTCSLSSSSLELQDTPFLLLFCSRISESLIVLKFLQLRRKEYHLLRYRSSAWVTCVCSVVTARIMNMNSFSRTYSLFPTSANPCSLLINFDLMILDTAPSIAVPVCQACLHPPTLSLCPLLMTTAWTSSHSLPPFPILH